MTWFWGRLTEKRALGLSEMFDTVPAISLLSADLLLTRVSESTFNYIIPFMSLVLPDVGTSVFPELQRSRGP